MLTLLMLVVHHFAEILPVLIANPIEAATISMDQSSRIEVVSVW
jgi:hypothetical protein